MTFLFTVCRYDLCDDIEIIDVPGDHYSILRQEEDDMQLITLSLKAILGDAGWTQAVPIGTGVAGYGERAIPYDAEEEGEDLEDSEYSRQLEAVGCIDPLMKRHMAQTLAPIAELQADGILSAIIQQPGLLPFNAAAKSLLLTDIERDISPLPSYGSDEEDQWRPWAELSTNEGGETPSERDGGSGAATPTASSRDPEYLLPEGTHHPAPRTQHRSRRRAGESSSSSPSLPLEVIEPCRPEDEDQKKDETVLIFCSDANGGVNGLDNLLNSLEIPVFVSTLPLNNYLWEIESMKDLGAIVAKTSERVVLQRRPNAKLIVGGTGFGGVVAIETAFSLFERKKQSVPVLLFDGLYSIKEQHRTLFWMGHRTKSEVDKWAQTAAQLYPLAVNAQQNGREILSLPGFAARLHQLEFSEALDWLSQFKPQEQDIADWDRIIHSMLVRLEYYRNLSDQYRPEYHVPGEVVLFSDPWEDRISGSLCTGGNAGVWTNIRAAALPVDVYHLPANFPVSGTTCWVACRYIEAVADRLVAQDWVPGGSSTPLIERQTYSSESKEDVRSEDDEEQKE